MQAGSELRLGVKGTVFHWFGSAGGSLSSGVNPRVSFKEGYDVGIKPFFRQLKMVPFYTQEH